MGKHTPGPWAIGHSFTADIAIREPSGECVAVTCELCEGEAEANARLIASAPELLAALRDCEARLTLLIESGRGKLLDVTARNTSRAVIAKATGG